MSWPNDNGDVLLIFRNSVVIFKKISLTFRIFVMVKLERMKRLFLSFTVLLVSVLHVSAKEQYIFTQISHEEGLTATINSIQKEKGGDVWLGTPEGLFRFNGNSLYHYEHQPLKDRQVFQTSMDRKGNLWVLTDRFAALRRSGEEEFAIVPVEGITDDIAIQAICHDEDGVWLGSRRQIFRYTFDDGKMRLWKDVQEKPDFRITGMAMMDNQTILCTSHNGIVLIDIDTGTVSESPFMTHKEVSSVLIDKKGRIWIAFYNNGVKVFDKNGNEIRSFNKTNSSLSNDVVLCMTERDSSVWAGTDGGGINRIDLETGEISVLSHVAGDASSLPAHSIKSIHTDEHGNIWAGSVRDGLIRISRSGMNTYSDSHIGLSSGLSNPTVLCLFQDKDEECIWIGTDGEGINRFDPKTNEFTHYRTSLKTKIVSIARYSDNELLLSSYADRIWIFNKKSGAMKELVINDKDINYTIRYAGRSINLINENNGDILIVGNRISRLDKRNGKCTRISSDTGQKTGSNLGMTGRDQGGIWLHNNHGIYYLQNNADSLKECGRLENDVIRGGHLGSDDVIWLATDKGLCRFNIASETFKHIETPLFSNATSVACDSKERIWVGTKHGLCAYLVGSDCFAMFGESDGAAKNEYLSKPHLLACNGDVYLGGVRGLLRIDKDFTIDESEIPVLRLYSIMADGRKVHVAKDKHVTLPQYSRTMQLRISAQEKDIFRQKMYRFEISGTGLTYETSSPVLELTQMPKPGKYVISASCTCRNGEWTEPAKILSMKIPCPWYYSWWFMTFICILFLTSVTATAIAARRRRMHARNIAQKEQEQKVYEEKVGLLINISHELRTPLTLIMAPLKRMLGETGQEDRDYPVLSRIYRQSRRMHDLLDMVLDLRKMEVGRNNLKIERIDYNSWIRETVEDVINEERESGIEVITELSPEIGMVEFDKRKCDTVLMNILINAIKHSSSGDRITIKSMLTDKGMVRISISDQGSGLKDIDPSKMFTRFYQGAGEQYGTGIGLSYSRILVELHGGKIGAENNPDRGATFWWDIPIKAVGGIPEVSGKAYLNELMGHNPDLIINAPEVDAFDTSSKILMLVDDNTDLLEFLREALSPEFMQVLTASSGNEAVRLLQEGEVPDIIVSDVNMPDGDGYSLCNRLKGSDKYAHIPVVLLTARGEEKSQGDSYRVGADGFMPKPFEIETLTELLRGILKRKMEIKKKYLDRNELASGEYGSEEESFILQMNRVISEHISDPDLDQQVLCREMGMSRAALYSKMRSITGAGAKEYITRIRIEKAKSLLETTTLTIAEISDLTGFSSQGYFSTAFKGHTGMTPRDYRASMT